MPTDEQRVLRLMSDFTYNARFMHGSDPESIEWFHEQVLKGPLQLWSGEVGDWIGEVRIREVADAD